MTFRFISGLAALSEADLYAEYERGGYISVTVNTIKSGRKISLMWRSNNVGDITETS